MAETTNISADIGPFDLEITRTLTAPRALVWRAWSDPELLKQWWAPKPVITRDCTMDLRPGGHFSTTMILPDGTEHPTQGCFLEVIDRERLVFTDALHAGWRPAPETFMTAIITFADHDGGTRYSAHILHKDQADRDRHEAMGFYDGWGTAIAQLGEVAAALKP